MRAPRLGNRSRSRLAQTLTNSTPRLRRLISRVHVSCTVANDPYFLGRRNQIIAIAARHALPAIYFAREFTASGGLLSYGASLADANRQVGIYTGKVLKGALPANLPVWQPSTFELVINLKVAKALRLEVSPTIYALADDVIE